MHPNCFLSLLEKSSHFDYADMKKELCKWDLWTVKYSNSGYNLCYTGIVTIIGWIVMRKQVLPVYNKIFAFQRIVVLIPVFKRGRGYCSIFFFLQHCINAVISSINDLTSANPGFKQLWLSLADKHPTRVELSDSLKKALRTLKARYRALSAFSCLKRWVGLTVYW